jgi:hypothetical protein
LVNSASTSYKGTLATGTIQSGNYNFNSVVKNITDGGCHVVIDSINRIVYLWMSVNCDANISISGQADINLLNLNTFNSFSGGQIPPPISLGLIYNCDVYNGATNTNTWGIISVSIIPGNKIEINFRNLLSFGINNSLQINFNLNYAY